MTYGEFEGGDTYASEVRNYGHWSRRILEWLDEYATAYRCRRLPSTFGRPQAHDAPVTGPAKGRHPVHQARRTFNQG
jgi:hypothetical protein